MGAVKNCEEKENLSGLCSTRSSSEMVGCIQAWPRQIVYIHSKLYLHRNKSHKYVFERTGRCPVIFNISRKHEFCEILTI